MHDREKKKQPNWVGLAIVLLLTAPEIAIPVAICGGIGYVVYAMVKSGKISAPSKKITYTRKPSDLDDCSKPLFCFHRDKGEHHVSRGKEIDPWDRPDIDISKYQKRQ